MNWDAIGSIGEIIGAIGVVVSLIYLATQIRQNSIWLKSTVIESAGTRTGDLTATVYADPDLSRIVSIGFTQDAVNLSIEEKQRFALIMTRVMRNQEINFVHFKSGLLDEESYKGFVQNMTIFVNSPLFEEWWIASSSIYRKDFCEKVEDVRINEKKIDYDPFRD